TEPKQRERVLGYTQAFSSIGGAMVTAASAWILTHGTSLPAIYGQHESWRYTLMSGLIPALPLIIIRPFLPESPAWLQKKAAGTLKRPSVAQLFSPELRRVTIVTTLMFAMSYGAAFGAIQHMPRIVPATPEVAPMTLSRPMPPDLARGTRPRQAAGGRRRAVVAGDRRPRRTNRPGDAAPCYREPARTAPPVPGSRIDRRPDRVLVCSRLVRGAAQGRNVLRGILHGCAIQFLGKLSAPGLSHASARYGRGLRGQRRRPHARHRLRVRDDNACVESVGAAARATRAGGDDRGRVR